MDIEVNFSKADKSFAAEVSTAERSHEVNADGDLVFYVPEDVITVPAGGKKGQQLAKASDEDGDLVWVDDTGTAAITINGQGPDSTGNFMINTVSDVEIAQLNAVLT